MKHEDVLKVNQLCANLMPDMVKLASQQWNRSETYNNRAHDAVIMLSRYMMLACTEGIEKFYDSDLSCMALHIKQVSYLIEELNDQYAKACNDHEDVLSELRMREFLLLIDFLKNILEVISDDAVESGNRILMVKNEEDEFDFKEFLSKFNVTTSTPLDMVPEDVLMEIFNEMNKIPYNIHMTDDYQYDDVREYFSDISEILAKDKRYEFYIDKGLMLYRKIEKDGE
jgi:hypothetical protein